MQKVVAGISGGVDSAVTAYLLKEQGYDVTCAVLRTWRPENGLKGRCCDEQDARHIAAVLGLPFISEDRSSEFREKVVQPFIDDYMNGLTPNPCVTCNRVFKWEELLRTADRIGAEFIATGHYAEIVRKDNGRYTVRQAEHREKDQTYVLYRLSQEMLARTIMPLHGMDKQTVRSIAEKAGIPVFNKPDSEDICFVTEGKYGELIEEETGAVPEYGNFVSPDGEILGMHKGIIRYTVGQRRGLGIAAGERIFVKEIRPETNEVVLSGNDDLFTDSIRIKDLNFMSVEDMDTGEQLDAFVKIRYNHRGADAVLEKTGPDEITIRFNESVRAAAPGQSAVCYDADGCIICGGIIQRN